MMMKGLAILALVSLGAPAITAQECAKDGVCDKHERCAAWKDEGECYRNKVRASSDDWDGLPTNIGSMISHSITPF